MRVLLVSKFLHHVGGVETYLLWLARALHEGGHEVGVVGMTPPPPESVMSLPDVPVWKTPTRTFTAGDPGRGRSAALSVWSPQAGLVMRRALHELEPDVVHFHGTCFQLTPAVVSAVARHGTRAVVTAHEYKLICANQTFFDDSEGRVCTDCVGASAAAKFFVPLRHRCIKGTLPVTLLGAAEGRVADRVWRAADPLVLAPSAFMRARLLEDGWSPERVEHLDLPWGPASMLAQAPVRTATSARDSVTFLGRLAPIKGADVLLRVWQRLALKHPSLRLRVVGDGSDRPRLERLAAEERIPRVDFVGRVPSACVPAELERSVLTAHPSQCHENSPYSVRESLMAGVPVVVSDVGGMPELVGGASGAVVRHDDETAWCTAIDREIRLARAGSPELVTEARRRAVSDEDHLGRLLTLYRGHGAAPPSAEFLRSV